MKKVEMKVSLIAKPKIDLSVVNEFLQKIPDNKWNPETNQTHDQEQISEFAGRMCYLSFSNPRPGGSKSYFQNILKSGHFSILEHGSWVFLIENISRACSHELVRHRHLSFSQISQRYVKHRDSCFVMPHLFENIDEKLKEKISEVVTNVHKFYLELCEELEKQVDKGEDYHLKLKIIRDCCRYILPEGTPTSMVVSGNIRAWRHVILLRSNKAAAHEIRLLTNKIFTILKNENPLLFMDMKEVPLEDGTFQVESEKGGEVE